MNNREIQALRDIGINISDVQIKYPVQDESVYPDENPTKFVLKGEFWEESDLQQLLADVFVLRAIRSNRHPAVKDLYEQLLTTAGLTKK